MVLKIYLECPHDSVDAAPGLFEYMICKRDGDSGRYWSGRIHKSSGRICVSVGVCVF